MMKIKEGLFFTAMILMVVDSVILLLGIPTYFFGFETNLFNNLIFITIIVCILLVSIFVYILCSKLIKNYYIVADKCIIFYKKGIEQYRIDFHDIHSSKYMCFSILTILEQSAFGYLKIKTNREKDILIDMSKKTAKKINENYFKIKFEK